MRKSNLTEGLQVWVRLNARRSPRGEDPFQIGNGFVCKCPLSDGTLIPLNQTNRTRSSRGSGFLLLFHGTPESFKIAI